MIITHSHKKIAENRQAKLNLFGYLTLYPARQAKPNLAGSTHITKNPTNQTVNPNLISGIFPPLPVLHYVDCQSGGIGLWLSWITALSRSKCRHIQSFLQRAKANALRLNELLHAELLSMAALTPAQLVINQATARYPQTGTTYTLLWITQPLLNRIIQKPPP